MNNENFKYNKKIVIEKATPNKKEKKTIFPILLLLLLICILIIFVILERLRYIDYLNFISNNPGYSTLKVRASAANEAYPIANVDIEVSKIIGEYEVIFYER